MKKDLKIQVTGGGEVLAIPVTKEWHLGYIREVLKID